MAQHDPYAYYYAQGYKDAQDANRKRKRPVAHNYKLVYISGWSDAVLNKPARYIYDGELKLK